MEFLHRKARVISVEELVEAIDKRTLKPRSVVLTFDDGYADNGLVAKPILDTYGLPATFFIASQTIDTATEFWWDELEDIILLTKELPQAFFGTVANTELYLALDSEVSLSASLRAQHKQWSASEVPPPTLRAKLFLQIWELLRPLPSDEQQRQLHQVRQWAGVAPSQRPTYRSLSRQQLQDLSQSSLHTLGAHTHSHPALSFHPRAVQQQELVDNKAFLETVTGKRIQYLTYPYGNYIPETVALAAELGFRAAFTTEALPIGSVSDKYRLGRFQVRDMPALNFAQQLQGWRQSS